MQVVKNNTYVYSNVHAGSDENADSDRKFLLQQQRACQARARQYSLETNQRRKALENRRRKWDIQEQRMRTEILQQRKQRLLEITERFQRSHVPPSQRTRPASSARVPTLDEAFSQIQVGQCAYTHQSSFPTGTSNIRRTCSSIPKPPEGSRGSRRPRAVSASQAYTKLMQEKSQGDFNTSQLPVNQLQENLVKDQEKLEQLQTQDHQDTQISHAESLSSLDSLENEVPQHDPGSKPDRLGSPEVHDTRRLSLLQRQLNCPSPPSKHCPLTSFQKKVKSPSPVKNESADEDMSVQIFLKPAEECKIDDQSQVFNIQSTRPFQKQLLAFSSGHKAHQYGTMTQEDILWDKASPCIENSAPQTLEAGRNLSHTEKYKRADYQNLADDNNNGRLTNSTLPKFAKLKKETEKTSADTLTSHIGLKSKKVRFLKGILKKTSKCIEDGDAKFSHSPGHFAFSKQVAIAVMDSLELSRFNRDKDSNKCTKKKLRWIDDMHIDGEENEKIVTKEIMNKPTDTPNNTTYSSPADPNLTKHAWSAVGPQKGKHPEPTEESKVEKAAFHATGLCVPRRAHSAKTGAGTILFHARRDTIIRPQTSSQIPRVISTQGKVLVPRPPPRPEFTIKPGNNDSPEGQLVPQCHILKTDKATILAPVPYSYACMNKTVSKGIHTLCQPDGQVGSGGNGFRKSILNCTPTDEEISLLWNDVRKALASKEGESRSLQAHNRPLSALPHIHANLSHVTIKGDSLSSGFKAVARMNNFLLVRSPVQRPTLEINMKNKTAASGYRNPPVFYQARVPITESKTNQMVHDQGSAEFPQSQRDLSDISLEEQKILQSLDRLNHRLQNARDVAAGNPTLKGITAFGPCI